MSGTPSIDQHRGRTGGRIATLLLVAAALTGTATCSAPSAPSTPSTARPSATVRDLPPPSTDGAISLESALAQRASVREFATTPLSTSEIGQLLWAAQGQTRGGAGRTAPSAGALYPVEVYAISGEQVWHYLPDGHRVQAWADPAARAALGAAAGQASVQEAPTVLVISVVPARTEVKYAERASRYVDLEAGHVGQNVLLQAVTLGLGAVTVGAFDDGAVAAALAMPAGEAPRYLIPVGHPIGS